MVLEKTLESPLDGKEIQAVHPKGNQWWIFIGRTDVDAETPILWPPAVKNWLLGKDPDAGKDWRQEKGMCWEPARDIPLLTKVMRKEARHMQRRDWASGVPLDILEHLPPKNQSLPTLLLCALTSDFTGGCPPPSSCSLCQRVSLQLQLIKFLGN